MLSRYKGHDETLAILRPEDRPWGLLVHVLGWIPVWGFVFNAAIWLHFKNRSREMVFHIQQSIQYQIFVLMPVLAWIVVSILTSIVGNLHEGAGSFLQTANTFLLSLTMTAAGLLAIYGGAMVYMGRGFLYPVIGPRVLEGTLRKYTEE